MWSQVGIVFAYNLFERQSTDHIKSQVAVGIYAIIQTWLLVLYALPHTPKTSASIACAALNVAGAVSFCLLSFLEHARSVRPSAVLTTYLFFALLGDIIRTRTMWAISRNRTVAISFTVSLAWKTLVLVLESIEKRRLLKEKYADHPPETTGNIWNLRFFYWLNPLLLQGFTREIIPSQLDRNDKGLMSEREWHILLTRWQRADQKSTHALLWIFVVHYKWSLASAVIPRLLLTGFRFAQPFLVHRATGYVSGILNTPNYGYGLIVAYFIVYTGIAV